MLSVFCDGGSRGNPGHSAFGFVVKKDGVTIKEGKNYIGIATNNFAEYTAIVEALRWLSENHKGESLKVFLDSQLAASQLSGIYKVKNANIRELLFSVRQLESNFGNVSYTHVPRAENKEADRLVNEALDEKLEIRLIRN